MRLNRLFLLGGLVLLPALLAACSFGSGPPPEAVTPVSTEGRLPAAPSSTPGPTPTPTPVPRVLNICLGDEPENLYLYGERRQAKSHILEAVYDGPIDTNGFDYQPVILEKLPDLAQGDAAIAPVPVAQGDWVVNAAGDLVQLAQGELVRPFGCNQAECAVAWDGGPLEMSQLSATFTLIEGLRWSDGVPLTAADSVFSYSLARACQSELGPCGGAGLATGNPNTVQRTASYTALDERTVQWVGLPGFLDPEFRANFFSPLPEHQLADLPPAELSEAEEMRLPLGWGPYILDRWVAGDHIRLHKNPAYFRAGQDLPRFDILVFHFIGQEAERNLSAILSGMCDVLDQSASQDLAGEEMETLLGRDADGDLQAYFATGTDWEHLDFGIQHIAFDEGYQAGQDPPAFFGDVRTRRALALCLDRQKVVETVLHGLSAVPDSYVPPDHPLFNSEIMRYEFDPAAGQALLEQTGWLDADGDPATPRVSQGVPYVLGGTPLSLTYLTSTAPQRQQAAQVLVDSLAECGFQINLEFLPVEELYLEGPAGLLFGRRFELAQFSWSTGVRPPCDLFVSSEVPGPPGGQWFPLGTLEAREFLFGWGGQNETGFYNVEYDRACRAALEALPGQPGYAESHAQTQEIFAAELPVIPLYLRLKLAVTRSDFCGLSLDATTRSEMWNLEGFDKQSGCQ